MADNIDYASFAGEVGFPRNPSDLVSTSDCPACFTPLTSTVCARCGLDLGHPAARELHDVSLAAAVGLDKRLDIIGRIRYDSQQAAQAKWAAVAKEAEDQQREAAVHRAAALASSPTTAIVAPAAAPVVVPAVVAEPAIAASAPLPGPAPTPAAPPLNRKHSSVQVTLLVVGISLLSVAAIFFLVYAFINFGIIWRSVIIASITVAAIATASMLRRRNLTATAEGIAVFGVVLVYLDAFALRANDFFGTAVTDGRLYWGATIVASSVLFMLWHRFSALRTPSIVGFTAFAPGVGVLVAGLARNGDLGTRAFLVVAAVAAAGLVYRLALPTTANGSRPGHPKTVERIIILCTTTLALVAGFFTAFTVAPASDWSGTIAAITLTVITAVHVWAIAPPSTTQPFRTFAFIFCGLGAVFATTAVAVAAPRIASGTFLVLAPPIAAVIVTLALESIAVRGTPAWKPFASIGAWCAGGIVTLTLLPALFIAMSWTAKIAALGITDTWKLNLTDTVPLTDTAPLTTDYTGWAVLSLTIIGALTAASWAATKVIRTRGPLLAWFGSGVLVAASALSWMLWPTVLNWLGISVVAVGVLASTKIREKLPTAYRIVLATLASLTGFLGYIVSWASMSTWWIGSILAVGLLLVARRIVRNSITKTALLGTASILVLIGSYAAALHLTHGASLGYPLEITNGVRFSSIAAVALFTLCALPWRRFITPTDRRLMFWLTGTASVLLLSATSNGIAMVSETNRSSLLLPEYVTSLCVQLVALVALVLWIAVPWIAAPKHHALKPERIAASLVVAPATYFALVAVTETAVLPKFFLTIAPIASAFLVATAALIFVILKPSATPRWALDISVVLVGLPSVVFAVLDGGEFAWFVLVLAAVTVLFLAINRDGLFAARSWRKHLGWLAIALATAGLWWRLGSNNIQALEPYVLPLAGVLLLTAALIARSETRTNRVPRTASHSAAPLVALGGLLVAILPLGINAMNGSLTRAIVVTAISAALLLVGSFATAFRLREQPKTARANWQPWLDVAALSGALGVIVTAFGRAVMTDTSEWSRDVWQGAALVVLILAGIGQAKTPHVASGRLRSAGNQALAIIPMTAVLAIEATALNTPHLGVYRALGLIVLFATVATLCFTVNRMPFGRAVAWVSTGYWALAAVATMLTFPNDPVPSLAPIASAVLVGAIALTSALMQPTITQRWTRDLGVILVGALSVIVSLVHSTNHTWLVLLLAAVAVLFLAIDSDGLFSSSSRRRHLGWVSLALATGGLCWRLSESEVDNLEPYVLPLAGALIIIALLLHRAASQAPNERSDQQVQAAPLIALGGLVVGIVPLALNAASGDQVRAVIIGAVAVVFLLAGSFMSGSIMSGSRTAQRWWDAVGVAGALGVIVLMVGRATYLPVSNPSRDAWIVVAFICLVAAAFGQAISRNEATDRIRAKASQSLGVFSMAAVLALEIPAFDEPTIGHIRVLGVVLLFAALHVIALTLNRAPFSRLVGWIAIAFAGIAAALGISLEAIDSPELVTVPIALALLATGAAHLRDVTTSGSWPWLAPGIALLLVPSLIESFQDQALWRIVGLGVIGVTVIVVGVVRRLQAPFVIGVIVVLIHGISTFLPQLRAAYEFVPWWLWLGIAGVILTVLAARYEQRIRDLKTVALKFAALR